jgi:uncharacterized protein YndB with AHSA1/START domain
MERTFTVTINAPIEKAFSAVDDESKIRQWMGGKLVTTYKNLKDYENPVGTKFKQKIIGGISMEGEIIAYTKPILLGVAGHNPWFKSALFYHFKPLTDTTTKLVCNLDIAVGSKRKKMLVKMLRPVINSLMRKQIQGIKRLAEES